MEKEDQVERNHVISRVSTVRCMGYQVEASTMLSLVTLSAASGGGYFLRIKRLYLRRQICMALLVGGP